MGGGDDAKIASEDLKYAVAPLEPSKLASSKQGEEKERFPSTSKR